MSKNDLTLKLLPFVVVLLLGVGVFQPEETLLQTVHAQSAQFDHITIVSALYLHQGLEGLLLLDKRNGNVWFMPRRNTSYDDPQFLLRVPFEKLDPLP